MNSLSIVAWAVGVISFTGLIIAARHDGLPAVRAVLASLASAALILLLTGQPFALFLFGINVLLVLGTWRLSRTRLWWIWIILLVILLLISKLPTGGERAARENVFRLGIAVWLGFSYLVFRLIHITVDMYAGRAGDVSLGELIVYALHPASLVAGPIDRIQSSVAAQRERRSVSKDFNQGFWRILVGAFVKFVITNPLYAFIDQHNMAHNPDQPTGVAWLWLFAYSFYLYTDFASYTSIAIGFGWLAGLKLPENFDRPYLSPSISLFWQRWHITLSTWLRDYIFFPLARALRARAGNRFRAPIQLLCHLTTMGAAGLWHGLSSGFVMWGLWHGLGLFVNGQLTRPTRLGQPSNTRTRARTVAGIAVTYLFVTLGWVFFAADLPTALRIFARLFGIS